MLAAADNAGLEASQALMLTWHGYARVATGDADGTSDMWTAADTLARHAHSSTPMAYGNLADCLRGLGEMRAADDAYDAAGRWAARMGSSSHINWIATERAVQAYHGAAWDTSESLLHQVDITYGVDEAQVRATAGRIALARGDHHRALADAAASIAYAETSNNNDLYFIGIALAAMCYSAADRLADAIADCDRFLSRWHESHGPPGLDHRTLRNPTDPRQGRSTRRCSHRGASLTARQPLARSAVPARRGAQTMPPHDTNRSAANHSPPTLTYSPPTRHITSANASRFRSTPRR